MGYSISQNFSAKLSVFLDSVTRIYLKMVQHSEHKIIFCWPVIGSLLYRDIYRHSYEY